MCHTQTFLLLLFKKKKKTTTMDDDEDDDEEKRIIDFFTDNEENIKHPSLSIFLKDLGLIQMQWSTILCYITLDLNSRLRQIVDMELITWLFRWFDWCTLVIKMCIKQKPTYTPFSELLPFGKMRVALEVNVAIILPCLFKHPSILIHTEIWDLIVAMGASLEEMDRIEEQTQQEVSTLIQQLSGLIKHRPKLPVLVNNASISAALKDKSTYQLLHAQKYRNYHDKFTQILEEAKKYEQNSTVNTILKQLFPGQKMGRNILELVIALTSHKQDLLPRLTHFFLKKQVDLFSKIFFPLLMITFGPTHDLLENAQIQINYDDGSILSEEDINEINITKVSMIENEIMKNALTHLIGNSQFRIIQDYINIEEYKQDISVVQESNRKLVLRWLPF